MNVLQDVQKKIMRNLEVYRYFSDSEIVFNKSEQISFLFEKITKT
jgi:hypothetical protein